MRSLNKPDSTDPNASITNFRDIKEYMKTKNQEGGAANPELGKMTLQDMKGHFEAEKTRFDDIQRTALRKKEGEMADEIQQMKKEKEMLRHKRDNDEKVMLDLVNELKGRKDRQLRAQIEQNEIQKQLKTIERDKISALERDKRRELEKLAADRENLRLQEEDVMDNIKSLEQKMYKHEKELQEIGKENSHKVENSRYL